MSNYEREREYHRMKREQLKRKNGFYYWQKLKRDMLFCASHERFDDCLLLLEEAREYKKDGDKILINEKDSDGWTPLFFLMRTYDIEYLPLFIEHGADINARDNKGNTPAHIAAGWKQENMLEYLLEHGADYQENYKGKTPLDVAKGRDVHHYLWEYLKYK